MKRSWNASEFKRSWNASEFTTFLSSSFKINFLPALNRKKTHTISLCASFRFFASHLAFEQSDRPTRKSYSKNDMAKKRNSETRAPSESGYEVKFLNSEGEGSTILRS
jgi:hypothetical protein